MLWHVGDSSALEKCSSDSSNYLSSALNLSPGGGPPTAPAYSTGENYNSGTGWEERKLRNGNCHNNCGITVTAGGR